MVRPGRSLGQPLPNGRDDRSDLQRLRDSLNRRPPITLPRSPGFNFQAPTEPVDPWDCQRWPNSPFCQDRPEVPYPLPQSGLFPDVPFIRNRLGRLRPSPFEIASHGLTNCQAWICVSPSIAGWSLPPVCVNYRLDNCQEEEPPYELTPLPESIPQPSEPPLFIPNTSSEGWVVGCRYFLSIEIQGNNSPGGDFWKYPRVNQWGHWPGSMGGLCLPVYGPILGIEVSQWNVGTLLVSVLSGGVGMLPSLQSFFCGDSNSVPGVNAYSMSAASWLTKLERIQERGIANIAQFHNPPIEGRIITSEVWFRSYGAVPRCINNRTQVRLETGAVHRYSIYVPDGISARIHSIRQAGRVPPLHGQRWGNLCTPAPRPPVPPNRRGDPPDMACCSCQDIERIIAAKLRPIYTILGWEPSAAPIRVAPETLIKQFGPTIYGGTNPGIGQVEVANLPQLTAAIAAANFYRGGLHRLPAELPNLSGDDNSDTTVHDVVTLWEWFIKELDGFIGHFPLKVKIVTDDGSEKEVKIDNVADFATEILGALVPIADDANLAHQYAARATAEAAKAANAAIVSQDYSKANAQFLGYRGNVVERSIPISFTPFLDPPPEEEDQPPEGDGPQVRAMSVGGGGGAGDGGDGGDNPPPPRTSRSSLPGSRSTIPGWQADGDDNLQDSLNQIKVMCGIIKAALVKKIGREDRIMGDFMRRDIDGDGIADATEWQTFLAQRRTRPANQQDPYDTPIIITDISPAPAPRPRTVEQPPRPQTSTTSPSPSPAPAPSPSPAPAPAPAPSPSPDP